MNGEHISRALNHLPDDMIAEAMNINRVDYLLKRITKIAACFVFIASLALSVSAICFTNSRHVER